MGHFLSTPEEYTPEEITAIRAGLTEKRLARIQEFQRNNPIPWPAETGTETNQKALKSCLELAEVRQCELNLTEGLYKQSDIEIVRLYLGEVSDKTKEVNAEAKQTIDDKDAKAEIDSQATKETGTANLQ